MDCCSRYSLLNDLEIDEREDGPVVRTCLNRIRVRVRLGVSMPYYLTLM